MKKTKILSTLILASCLTLSACGGGGGGGGIAGVGGGIGGTGVSSTGTIDGFGSIFVNGVEYETGNSDVSVDGKSANEDSLRLGMVVTVRGTINDDGVTGTADQVIFNDDVQGPVSAIEPGQDGDSLLLTVLGVKVIVERTGTVFDHVTFDTLAVGDLVEVSGFVEGAQQIRATRIEKKSDFEPGASEIELKGIVSGLTATTFNLETYVVDFSNADLTGIPGGSLVDGMPVEVHGTLSDNLILASKVKQEDDITSHFDGEDDVSIQGAIASFVDQSSFVVNGVTVDASSASLEPTGLVLANGVVVEVEGVWNGNTLIADEVKSRRGRIELEAKVASVNAGESSITMKYFNGTVTVLVDSRTQLDDDTDAVDSLALADITGGDFLEVEAGRVGEDLVASRVRREEPHDDVLQAPVDSFNAEADITVLGIMFSTAGAQFGSREDNTISPETFFAQLQVGDLVKVRDNKPADGTADEVDFEHADALDGGEFEDDSEAACDKGDDGANDDCDAGDDDGSDDDCVGGVNSAGNDCNGEVDHGSDDDCVNGVNSAGDDCNEEVDDGSDDDCIGGVDSEGKGCGSEVDDGSDDDCTDSADGCETGGGDDAVDTDSRL